MRIMKTDLATLKGFAERSSVHPVTGCWEWTGSINKQGYGVYSVLSHPHLAHRRAYQLANPGEDISALLVCHKCDNRKCISPEHLFSGTQSDNIKDCVAKGRHARKSAHGEDKPDAKLKEADIPVIRRRISAGEACTRIAKSFGVSHTVIYQIKLGKLWRHVP